jgi:hypothetical protein
MPVAPDQPGTTPTKPVRRGPRRSCEREQGVRSGLASGMGRLTGYSSPLTIHVHGGLLHTGGLNTWPRGRRTTRRTRRHRFPPLAPPRGRDLLVELAPVPAHSRYAVTR